MSLGERLKIVRGATSQKEFGELFDVTPNTLRRYETGVNPPTTDFVMAVCERFRINPMWLITGEGPKHLPPSNRDTAIAAAGVGSDQEAQKEIAGQAQSTSIPPWQTPDPEIFHYVPMAKAQLSAGGGAFILTEDFTGYYAFRRDWLTRIATGTDKVVLMTVQGNSMSPTIMDKDTVMIDIGRTGIIEGQIYAMRLDDTIMIKRLTQRPGDIINVISDNKEEYETYQAKRSDLYIIGQIIFFSRDLVSY